MSKGNLQVEEGISNWILVSIVLACASPAVTLNVWPRLEQMLGSGFTSNALGIALLVTLSALGMTCVPFAMKKSENWGFWLICLVFGIGLGILNYTMAIGAVGKSRDEEAGGKALLIQKAAALRTAIAESEKSRRDLPAFKWTTQEMVGTAAKAVDLALAARDQECGKVGDICRARVSQLGSRQAELADLESHRGNTKRANELDEGIHRVRSELSSLGPIPTSADQQAGRIAKLLTGIGFLKGKPVDEIENVADWLVHAIAIVAEAFALGMPRIIVTALSNPSFKKDAWRALRHPILEGREHAEKQIKPVSQIPSKVPKTRPTSAQVVSPAGAATLAEWKRLKLISSTNRTRTWDVYSDYQAWAKNDGREVLPFPAFNEELKKLGVKEETDPALKRDFYLEVAIKTTLKAVS